LRVDTVRGQVRERVLAARRALAQAAADRDRRAVRAAMDELEDALMMARARGVRIPGPEEDGRGTTAERG
jgi:hypothetical protein